MLDELFDLVLGSTCTVCARPGRVLCRLCCDDLPRSAFTCWPTPCPPGLARPTAVGEYDGALKLMINAHKERQRIALARPLGDLLAEAVLGHLGPPPRHSASRQEVTSVVLVPVPSRPSVVRRRGHDPLLRLTRRAAGRLRHLGYAAHVDRGLRSVRTVEDQAGLGAAARARNLEGSMRCVRRRSQGGPATGPETTAAVLVVDDVVTTGATLREAQRALEDAGVRVTGAAAVAATRRRVRRPGA